MTSQGFSPSLDDRVLSPRRLEAVSGGGGTNGAAYSAILAKNTLLRNEMNARLATERAAAAAAAPTTAPPWPIGGMMNFKMNADGTIQGLEGLSAGGGIGGIGGVGAGAGGAGGTGGS